MQGTRELGTALGKGAASKDFASRCGGLATKPLDGVEIVIEMVGSNAKLASAEGKVAAKAKLALTAKSAGLTSADYYASGTVLYASSAEGDAADTSATIAGSRAVEAAIKQLAPGLVATIRQVQGSGACRGSWASGRTKANICAPIAQRRNAVRPAPRHAPRMRAMVLSKPGPVAGKPLQLVERSAPQPARGELQIRVEVCGVCRTDLHVVEGDLAPHRQGIIPGHEVVGRVAKVGPGCARFAEGARVGIAWLRSTCGVCRFCQRGAENLCLSPRFTGWDEDGGYAELAVVPEAFACSLPEHLPAAELAPLLCAGIIGYRAWRRSGVPPGGRLGLFGFGASAHVTIQVARHHGCEVYVFSRGGEHRELARELGAAWVGDSFDRPPHPLDGAILFAPAGELVPPALAALDRGATLAIAGIHLSDVPALNYQRHLFQERTLQSVTANTREDGLALLKLAAAIPIRTRTRPYALEQANEALLDLKEDRIRGAAVLELR